MLISCTSCYSKYLLNSADLKPDGRTVQCVKCGNQWFQDHITYEKDELDEIKNKFVPSNSSLDHKDQPAFPISNLPSTYVVEKKVSVLNSILVVLFVFVFIGVFWVIRNLELNNFVLVKFYLDEFVFNIKLIFNDIAKIIYQIIN